ncbi:transposase [Gracilibacillus oryzae]|uniref:Transposase n=1 Tax=Gracilibacillus oryzae TaxID=1672701 RepID=A0A7C8KW65_9BACI|nr:transposase [Gracilibacillus oryzae]KAB8126811.1 transposase [Gracilibacillus oryzae]
MPRKARVKSRTGIYHIMFRGANRQEIFHDEEDNLKFIEILKKYKEKFNLQLYAWCLMSNHIHLLLKEGQEAISVTMKRIAVSFAQYYNWKYRTTGHLFQDRFKSENVETRKYLLTVVRYIHQNPLKAGIVSQVEEWNWSSCLHYYDRNPDDPFLNSDFILRMFSSDRQIALQRFREFNERSNQDVCLDDNKVRKLTDEEARNKIKKLLGTREIAQVKSLPKSERDNILRKVKQINGISQRQSARILGVSISLVHRA